MIFDALLQNSEVFGKTLEECLMKIERMTEDEVIIRLVKELLRDKISDEVMRARKSEEIVKNNSLFDFIKELDIYDGDKWNLICFLKDIKGYAEGAAALIRNYATYFYNELEKHRNRIDKFRETVLKRIEDNSIEFISELFKSDFKTESYEEISITVTYLHYYSLYFYTTNKIGHIALGINYESILAKLQGTSEIDRGLTVLKNLSDRTRFEIIKLLLKKDYFGQELAFELNITTATVSYHMNQLFASNLIEIERMEHKAFYKLKKGTVKKTLEFLAKELEL
jgi:DNA-binding transcriptional ArsR family regulator